MLCPVTQSPVLRCDTFASRGAAGKKRLAQELIFDRPGSPAAVVRPIHLSGRLPTGANLVTMSSIIPAAVARSI